MRREFINFLTTKTKIKEAIVITPVDYGMCEKLHLSNCFEKIGLSIETNHPADGMPNY